MKNLIQETIEKIKQQHIVPEAKGKYLLKKHGAWVLLASILILASISLAIGYDAASQLDWDLYRFMQHGRMMYLFSLIPYFWISLIAIFLVAAFFEIRQTENGYRFSWLKMWLIIAGGIFLFGLIMLIFGYGGRLHTIMSGKLPFYGRHILVTKETQWMQSQKGLLAGTIQATSGRIIYLRDLKGQKWDVFVDDDTFIFPMIDIADGEMIKIIGQARGNDSFEAKEIRPWMGRGMMRGNNYRNGQSR